MGNGERSLISISAFVQVKTNGHCEALEVVRTKAQQQHQPFPWWQVEQFFYPKWSQPCIVSVGMRAHWAGKLDAEKKVQALLSAVHAHIEVTGTYHWTKSSFYCRISGWVNTNDSKCFPFFCSKFHGAADHGSKGLLRPSLLCSHEPSGGEEHGTIPRGRKSTWMGIGDFNGDIMGYIYICLLYYIICIIYKI